MTIWERSDNETLPRSPFSRDAWACAVLRRVLAASRVGGAVMGAFDAAKVIHELMK